MAEARKDTYGKPRWDLLPFDALDRVADVAGYGAAKYAPRDWEKGRPWGDYIAAALRHISAFNQGENVDPESRLPHLSHAALSILFVLAYQIRKEGFDDRA